MKAGMSFRFVAAAMLAAGALMGACESQGRTERAHRSTWPHNSDAGKFEGDFGAAPAAPAPAPRAQTPAPAPAQPQTPPPAPRQEQPRSTGACRPNVPAGFISSSMAFPTGEEATSAILVTQVMPREVRANTPYNYEIHVCNLTNGSLQNVVVTSTNTDNMTIQSSQPALARGADGSAQWVVGDLAPKATQVIRVSGVAQRVGTTSNCISVVYNNALCVVAQVVEPALAVTKQAPAEVLICDTIPIRIEVTNKGTGIAENVRVRDNLPEGLTVDGKNALDLDAGSLAAGQSKVLTVNAKAARTGRFENFATASAAGGLTAQSNNTTTLVRQPMLAIDAECSGNVLIGRTAGARFTVRNTGDAPSANTVLNVTLPANTTFVSADNNGAASGGRVTWNLGTLEPNATRTVNVSVRTGGAGRLEYSGTVSGTCAQAVTDTCSSSVEGVPDLGTLFTDVDGVILVGNPQPYTYEVQNQGQVNLTRVRMILTLPAGIEFVSSTATPAPRVDGRKIEFDIGTLPAGQKKGFTVVCRATAPGQVLLVTETTAAEISNPVRDDETTNFIARE